MMSSVSDLIGAAGFPAAVTKIGLGLKPVLPRGGRPRPSRWHQAAKVCDDDSEHFLVCV